MLPFMKQGFWSDRLFQWNVSISTLVTMGLAWSYLVRDFLMPLIEPGPVRVILVCLLLCCVHFLYSPLRLKLYARRSDFLWFLLSFVTLFLLNLPAIPNSLGGDELYHADQATLTMRVLEFLWTSFPNWNWLKTRPIAEIVSELNLVGAILFIGAFLLAHRFRSRLSRAKFYGLLFLGFVIFAFLLKPMVSRLELHPPLRLLPFFLSQALFGFHDLSYRLAPMIGMSFVLGCLGAHVARRTARWSAGVFTVVASASIPAVAHIAGIAEPSAFAYCAWLGSYLILKPDLRIVGGMDREQRLICCGLWIGVMAIARQTSIAIWPVVIIYLWLWRAGIRTWILTLIPGLFCLPLLYTMKKLSYVVAQGSAFENLWISLVSFRGFTAIFRSITPIWIFILLVLACFIVWRKRDTGPVWPFLLGLIPCYGLYFSIWDYLWGVGRYHAEYGGAILAICIAAAVPWLRGRWLAALGISLFFYGMSTMRNLWQDVGYVQWPDRRITTESTYPYKEALSYLKRQDIHGKFVFLGGVPVNGEMFLYLRGFTYEDIQNFRSIQNAFTSRQAEIATIDDFLRVMKELEVRWIVIQSGEKREIQHRTPEQNKFIKLLEDYMFQSDVKARPQLFSFWGSYEGAIHLVPIPQNQQIPSIL